MTPKPRKRPLAIRPHPVGCFPGSPKNPAPTPIELLWEFRVALGTLSQHVQLLEDELQQKQPALHATIAFNHAKRVRVIFDRALAELRKIAKAEEYARNPFNE